MVPHKAGYINLSPREAFSGRKIDFKRDLRIGFGDYAEIFNINSDNSMASRTSAAISLGPTGNASGSVKFLSLVTNRIVVRDQFKILPISDLIIESMNKLEATSSSLLSTSSWGVSRLRICHPRLSQPMTTQFIFLSMMMTLSPLLCLMTLLSLMTWCL